MRERSSRRYQRYKAVKLIATEQDNADKQNTSTINISQKVNKHSRLPNTDQQLFKVYTQRKENIPGSITLDDDKLTTSHIYLAKPRKYNFNIQKKCTQFVFSTFLVFPGNELICNSHIVALIHRHFKIVHIIYSFD